MLLCTGSATARRVADCYLRANLSVSDLDTASGAVLGEVVSLVGFSSLANLSASPDTLCSKGAVRRPLTTALRVRPHTS